jgi:hypothetical protein
VRVGRDARLTECIVGSGARVQNGSKVNGELIVSKSKEMPAPAFVETARLEVGRFEAGALSPSFAIKTA